MTRQIEHARAYAATKGWTVGEAHVYVDDGISGAEFAKRPGLVGLINALSPRPPFQVLVMSEEGRLGREQIETAYLLIRSCGGEAAQCRSYGGRHAGGVPAPQSVARAP